MAVKDIYKNPKVKMFISGVSIFSKAYSILLPAQATLAKAGIDVGVSLTNKLLDTKFGKANDNSPFAKIIEDKQIERAIHSAICAIFLQQSGTHANHYYKDKLCESRVEKADQRLG